MLRQEKGFTLYEAIVVFCLLSVMTTMALPSFISWRDNASYRKVARDLTSALREARSLAIKSNLEHRLEVDLDNRRFRLVHGNRPANSTESSWGQNIVINWSDLPTGPILRATSDCSKNEGVVKIHFNPVGSSDSLYLCILDSAGVNRFQVGVSHAATGRIVIRQWQPVASEWK